MTLCLLAACADEAPETRPVAARDDPALAGALGDQIMVDPDLVMQNEPAAGGAIAAQSGGLPPDDDSPAALEAARREALQLVGGTGSLKDAPAARAVAADAASGPLLTAAARAAASPAGGGACAGKVEYAHIWATRLPKPFPVYPRGNVQEAAGTDKAGCSLRVISFTTPVPLDDVADFYYTRAIAAGYKSDHVRQGPDNILGGTRNGAAYTIWLRKLASGRTEVDLVTSGN